MEKLYCTEPDNENTSDAQSLAQSTHGLPLTKAHSMAAAVYDIYRDAVKITSGNDQWLHKIGKVVGSRNGRWVVRCLRDNTEVELKETSFEFVPKDWQIAASRFTMNRLQQYFDAPGRCSPLPTWHTNHIKCEPPSRNDTIAFWGQNCFQHMYEAARRQIYSRNKGTNTQFLHAQSTIMARSRGQGRPFQELGRRVAAHIK